MPALPTRPNDFFVANEPFRWRVFDRLKFNERVDALNNIALDFIHLILTLFVSESHTGSSFWLVRDKRGFLRSPSAGYDQ